MRHLLNLFFVLVLAWGGSFSLSAQTKVKPKVTPVVKQRPAVLKIDSAVLKVRKFSAEALHNYSLDKAFIYDNAVAEHQSWWDRFWNFIWELIRRLFGGRNLPNGNFGFLKYLIGGVLLAGIVFAVFKLTGLDLRIFIGKSKAVEVPYYESLENIHEIDFDEEIRQAIDQGNYRLAVRLLYLQTLKRLNDLEVIYWQPEKTNETYVNEVQDPKKKADFKGLTRQFEYIWYGDFSIDASHFIQIRDNFQQFNSKGQ